jgi:hypothetical protein
MTLLVHRTRDMRHEGALRLRLPRPPRPRALATPRAHHRPDRRVDDRLHLELEGTATHLDIQLESFSSLPQATSRGPSRRRLPSRSRLRAMGRTVASTCPCAPLAQGMGREERRPTHAAGVQRELGYSSSHA